MQLVRVSVRPCEQRKLEQFISSQGAQLHIVQKVEEGVGKSDFPNVVSSWSTASLGPRSKVGRPPKEVLDGSYPEGGSARRAPADVRHVVQPKVCDCAGRGGGSLSHGIAAILCVLGDGQMDGRGEGGKRAGEGGKGRQRRWGTREVGREARNSCVAAPGPQARR